MKKGVRKIVWGGVVFLAGIVVSIAMVIPLMRTFLHDHDVKFQVPGSVVLTIDKPGKYYLWNNYQTIFEGRSFSVGPNLPGGYVFSLVGEKSGEAIPIESDLSLHTAIGGDEKQSVGYFEITDPGKYQLTVTGDEGERIMSFGPSFFDNLFLFIGVSLLGALIMMGSMITALILAVMGIVELASGKRENKAKTA